MVASKLSLGSLAILLVSAYASPTDFPTLDKRATVLADGTSPAAVVGNLPDWGLIFRASGYLAKDECASTSINTCYTQKLSASSTETLDSGLSSNGDVQTNFISTGAVEANGDITGYVFKLFLKSGLSTPDSAGSVPLVQVVSKEPVDGQGSATKVWLDARDDKVGIYAFSDTPVVSVPLPDFVDKTTVHTWTVRGGTRGWANIEIKDEATGNVILEYLVGQPVAIDSYRMRVGPTRLANSNSPYTASFGDWSAQLL
ncbi:hypothetical protein FRC09_018391 [Ceratobasidium sp. 395]|nr:hypothetical protein FRC09_018391 [Ceratobasidium sp. 395]